MPAAVRKRLNADTASAFSTPCVALAPPPSRTSNPEEGGFKGYTAMKKLNRDFRIWHLVIREWLLNDGQIQNPSAQC
jgi:hypothetical protein